MKKLCRVFGFTQWPRLKHASNQIYIMKNNYLEEKLGACFNNIKIQHVKLKSQKSG